MKDLPGTFDALLDRLHPEIRQAFEDAIERIVTTAKLRDIEGLLERGDVEGLLDALHLSPDYFREVQDAVEQAFHAGGQYQASLSASLSSIPFNRRHWAAEAWARENGSRLIVEITEGTRDGVRQYITEGLQQGRGTNDVAREIVGQMNRATGKREGGIVGLTRQQASYVINARAEIEALDASYFQRAARDRRYDRMIRKAIKDGKPLAKADVDRIVQRYTDGLKIRRGDVIARTETHSALNAGRYEAMRQTAEDAGMDVSRMNVKWQAARDGRTRDSHAALRGKTAVYGEAFVSPLTSARMRFPGDRQFGAPASELIHCRCTLSADWSDA